MTDIQWLADYFENYRKALSNPTVYSQLAEFKELILTAHKTGKKIIFVGNGGSAAMSSHAAVDFTKTAGIRAVNFNEADLITCLANDYGYENWVKQALEFYADPGDVIVLISSSGKSPNMVRGAEFANAKGYTLVTFTGFDKDNPLRQLGKLNIWLNSKAYNYVENAHQTWILATCDLVIESLKK